MPPELDGPLTLVLDLLNQKLVSNSLLCEILSHSDHEYTLTCIAVVVDMDN